MNQSFEDVIESLFAAYGLADDSVPKKLKSAIERAINMAEDAYRKADRDGYVDHAIMWNRATPDEIVYAERKNRPPRRSSNGSHANPVKVT